MRGNKKDTDFCSHPVTGNNSISSFLESGEDSHSAPVASGFGSGVNQSGRFSTCGPVLDSAGVSVTVDQSKSVRVCQSLWTSLRQCGCVSHCGPVLVRMYQSLWTVLDSADVSVTVDQSKSVRVYQSLWTSLRQCGCISHCGPVLDSVGVSVTVDQS